MTYEMLQKADRIYRDFQAGKSIDKEAIQGLLAQNKIYGEITRLHYGNYRKVIVWLRDGDEDNIFKIALHPSSVQMMRQEAQGYEFASRLVQDVYSFPRFCHVTAKESLGIARLDKIDGSRLRLWQFPQHTLTSLHGISRHISLEKYLENIIITLKTGDERDTLYLLAEKMLRCSGKFLVPLSPSHGDFASWNLIRDVSGRINILDFEHFRRERVSYFDDWHWFVLPIASRVVRFRLQPLFIKYSGYLSNLFWMRIMHKEYQPEYVNNQNEKAMINVLFFLYIFEVSTRFCEQNQFPDIVELIGLKNYTFRERLLQLFHSILANVLI